ncbi:MAG: hypothetical protein AAB425_15430, partial [Bdellovibrionota bacterium]
IYQNGIIRLLTLSDSITFPIMTTNLPSGKAIFIFSAGTIAVAGITAATVAYGPLGALGALWAEGMLIGIPAGLIVSAGFENESMHFRIIKDQTGKVVARGEVSRNTLESMQLKAGRKVFSGCKTAGCVYYMAENLKTWTKMVNKKINHNVKLVEGLKLDRTPTVRKAKAIRVLNRVAELVAAELPIGEFTPVKP